MTCEIPELDHDLLTRAKLQYYLGLEVTGDYFDDVVIKRVGASGTSFLIVNGCVVGVAYDVYGRTSQHNYYKTLGGKQNLGHLISWDQRVFGHSLEADKDRRGWFVANNPKISSKLTIQVLSILRDKGIKYHSDCCECMDCP